jgi:hypothetical protein
MYADDEARLAAYAGLGELADWSAWAPLTDALPHAPRSPGVYLLLETGPRVVVHVGRAGERAGGGAPQGLHGRLRAYLTGSGAVTGFVETALDRALADRDWVRARLDEPTRTRPTRAWAAAAVRRLELEVSWATCADADEARWLETRVVELLRPHGLWGR